MPRANAPLFLGIDAGTTALKAALFDELGNLRASDLQEYELETPASSIVELDPEIYWQACCRAVRGAVARSGAKPETVVALAISSQGETLICLDATGTPTRKAIVWLDSRALDEAAIISREFSPEEVYHRTGQPEVTPTWPAAKILWLRRHEPDSFQRAALFLLVEDYLLYRLTGQTVTEYGLQTSSLLLDIQEKRWWSEMLDCVGISAGQMGRLAEPGACVGPLTEEGAAATGLTTATLAITGSLDQTMGAIGAGNIAPGIISETTGGALASVVSLARPAFDPLRRLPCHYHARPDTYCLLPWSQTAGMALRWFRDRFFASELAGAQVDGVDTYAAMIRLAEEIPPGSDGVLVLPHLEGAACPEFDPAARGVFFGLGLRHSRAHLIRAIMESVAYMLRSHLAIVAEMGLQSGEIRSLGGGARSDLWLQIKADVLQLPVRRVMVDEAACLGAALLASVAVGAHPDLESASSRMVRLGETLRPNPELAAVYEAGYRRYRELYERLKPMFTTA